MSAPAAADSDPGARAADYLGVLVGSEQYALPLHAVREILRVPPITDVPRVAPHIRGIFSLRGTVVTLVDLARRLGIDASLAERSARVLIVEQEGEPIGLLVDAVTSVARLGPEDIQEPPRLAGIRQEIVAGLGRRGPELYILLDLAQLLR